MASNPSAKRKQPPDCNNQTGNSKRTAKRVKTSKARTILSQSTDKALSKNGDLDVSAFVKAREHEIKAMESSMSSSRKSLATRAFQQVPKDLRRRTASHNVKKVPKRLRARAAKEMKEDNTPTVNARRRKPTPHMRLRVENAKRLESLRNRIDEKRKKAFNVKHGLNGPDPAEKASKASQPPRPKKNTLATPMKQFSKYRKRQVHKSWLPTHIWHAKRAHMPEPKMPLWRFAIPLSPTERVYRPTHRAGSSRGCVVWDTSYMSTISVKGVEASLLGLLRAIGVEETALSGKKGAKWRRGTRLWEGWIRERDRDKGSITEVQIIWCVESAGISTDTAPREKKGKRQYFLRVHPSAFLQVWTEVVKVAKIQKPSPDVEDLRFEIGSIEITGPGSTEALVGTLHPKTRGSTDIPDDSPERVWSRLCSLTNPSTLPASPVLSFNIHDPRLFHPPRTVKSTRTENGEHEFLTLLADWPVDTTASPSLLFSHTARYAASRLPSQKAINRRKGEALPGIYPAPLPSDPSIPIILCASRAPSLNMQGTWTILLPWKCVLPAWYSLVHYPLSTGGEPRFGGLEEKRQILYEQGQPWFPGDYPGARAGWQWEIMEREKRKQDWQKRPKSKRVSWDTVDLGDGKKGEVGTGWSCDWERLFEGQPPPQPEKDPNTQSEEPKTASTTTDNPPKKAPAPATKATSAPSALPKPPTEAPQAPILPPKAPLEIVQLPSSLLSTVPSIPAHALTSIHLTLLSGGSPTTCARIYRIPTNVAHRKRWLSLLSSIQSTHPKDKNSTSSSSTAGVTKGHALPLSVADLPSDAPSHVKRQALARALLNGPVTPAEDDYPACPPEEDLIGFVTTGNYNLGMGRSTAIGSIAIARVYNCLGASDGTEVRGASEAQDTAGKITVRRLNAQDHVCIVRNAGQNVGRLARWHYI